MSQPVRCLVLLFLIGPWQSLQAAIPSGNVTITASNSSTGFTFSHWLHFRWSRALQHAKQVGFTFSLIVFNCARGYASSILLILQLPQMYLMVPVANLRLRGPDLPCLHHMQLPGRLALILSHCSYSKPSISRTC